MGFTAAIKNTALPIAVETTTHRGLCSLVAEHHVEQLCANDEEATRTLAGAFGDSLDNVPLTPAQRTRTWVNLGVWRSMSDDNDFVYGIRKDEKLVCIAVLSNCVPQTTKRFQVTAPLRWILDRVLAMALRAGCLLRWQLAIELTNIRQETPKRKKDGYLHLIALGTLPSYQGQGLGRNMLRFIRQMAERKGAKGILLDTHSDNPAYHLYLKEGYIVEREFRLGHKGLVWMRLDFGVPRQAHDNLHDL